jgi:hypothetical protein
LLPQHKFFNRLITKETPAPTPKHPELSSINLRVLVANLIVLEFWLNQQSNVRDRLLDVVDNLQ